MMDALKGAQVFLFHPGSTLVNCSQVNWLTLRVVVKMSENFTVKHNGDL